MVIIAIVLAVLLWIGLTYAGRAYWGWVAGGALALAALGAGGVGPPALWGGLALAGAVAAVALGVPGLRRLWLTGPLMPLFARAMPTMSDTEREALESGTVWWDGDLFSGRPAWHRLMGFRAPELTERERAFLDGPVEELCRMLDNWEVIQRRELPQEVWDFLARHRFFGMIIPTEYGGLGFSAQAHSAVITKLASRSIPAAVTVMVPNSLGPAELLLHYGTEAQQRHFLPRLARGEEVPCFALTGPEAGSDAAATESRGVVCYGQWEGREVLGMRLDWEKRYITLGPDSTLLGLAFDLRDPDRLLGGEEAPGITCALIPSRLPGIEIGQRHDPMGLPFSNGPNFGRDVFVPLDAIIGGAAMAGKGWRMLMESLAAGRSISLPSLSVGAAEVTTRLSGAYATVREQFNHPIGVFEGVEEPLARIGGLTYLMDATRRVTSAAIDSGQKPAVVSGIVKRYLTEMMRQVVNDGMDIFAGKAICRGPRNVIERAYAAVPVGITVEGANILTRSMIIFGQGAIRCHPFVLEELAALRAGDAARFDRLLFGHLNHVARNAARTLVMGAIGTGRVPVGGVPKALRRDARRISRLSAAFALVADVSLGVLGGSLKRREKLSGRLADVLAYLYLASMVIKRYADRGAPQAERPYARWACEHALYAAQQAMAGLLDNYPIRPVGWALRRLVFPWGARWRPPADALGAQVAHGLLEDRPPRERLTGDIYIPAREEQGFGQLEGALDKVMAAREARAKIHRALREGRLDAGDGHLEQARHAGVISEEELQRLRDAEAATAEAIRVDAYDPEAYRALHG